jgi:hypothetical protein
MSDPRIEIRTVPVIDTGVGKSRGYANDAEFVAAADREFSAALYVLSAEVRERFWHDEQRRFLLGS